VTIAGQSKINVELFEINNWLSKMSIEAAVFCVMLPCISLKKKVQTIDVSLIE